MAKQPNTKEVTVAGKKVWLYVDLPSAQHLALLRGVRRASEIVGGGDSDYDGPITLERHVGDLISLVAKWEFSGDPGKLKSWGKLNVWHELQPLIVLILEHLTTTSARVEVEAKN